ncbi:MAG TPA: hypothetical protein VH601_19605 [Bryobacteraceae bacterium]|jgi:hypothetical protein
MCAVFGQSYWPSSIVFWSAVNVANQSSVTAGTIFQETRKPLTDWFRAMYWVTTQKNGGQCSRFATGAWSV